MKRCGVQILIALTSMMVMGIAVAQTTVLRDADERERKQKNASIANFMQQAARNYQVVSPGVVRDKTTGLEWMRCSMGQDWSEKMQSCEGSSENYTLDDAQTIVRRLNKVGGYDGKTDWRLPTKDELTGLVVCSSGRAGKSCADGSLRPSIAQTVFPMTIAFNFWSSSPHADISDGGWVVSFGDGYVWGYMRNGPGKVRLVRSIL